MNKKLIGYKIIKEFPTTVDIFKVGYVINGTVDDPRGWGDTVKMAAKYPEYWEPVYEEEFKVGDWVYLSYAPKEGNGMSIHGNDDGVYQLLTIDENKHPTGHLLEHADFMFKMRGKYFRTSAKNILRKATAKEIEKELEKKNNINNIKIKGYAPIIDKGYVKFGCQCYSSDFIITLAKALTENNIDMDYKDEICKLSEYLKNL